MRIIHLSDLHINEEKLKHDLPLLWDALLSDLKKQALEKPIDLIVITGDIIDQGGKGLADITAFYKKVAGELVHKLAAALELSKDRFIIIPGNHDVVEPKSPSKIREANNAFSGLLDDLSSLNEVNKFISEQVLLTGDDDPHLVVKRLNGFRGFVKEFHNESDNTQINSIYSAHVIELNKAVKVGVAAFNSAWACHYDKALQPKDVLFGTRQVIEAGSFFKERKTDFNIALLHHPLTDLSESEQTEINVQFRNYHFSVLMCGHYHSERAVVEKSAGHDLLYLRADSAFSPENEKEQKYIAGYAVLDFQHGTDNDIGFRLRTMKFNRSYGSFVPDIMGPAGATGEYKDSLKGRERNDHFIDFLRGHFSDDVPQSVQRKVRELSLAIEKGFKALLPTLPDDKAALLEQKIFPKDKLHFFRQDYTLQFEITRVDKNHFRIREKQKFKLITSRKNVTYDTYIYQEKEDSRRDKSSLQIKKLKINGQNYLKKVTVTDTINAEGRREIVYAAGILLPQAGSYEIERDIESINSLIYNGIWKIDIRSVVAGLKLKVKNVNNYIVDVVEFGNNTTFTKDIRELPKSGRVTTEETHDLLLPGDGFLIIVRNK